MVLYDTYVQKKGAFSPYLDFLVLTSDRILQSLL